MLRCFQHLSFPHVATQLCSWRNNWYTSGASNPVAKNLRTPERTPSTAGHVKPRGNPAGPSAKAKYSLATDSEAVP